MSLLRILLTYLDKGQFVFVPASSLYMKVETAQPFTELIISDTKDWSLSNNFSFEFAAKSFRSLN